MLYLQGREPEEPCGDVREERERRERRERAKGEKRESEGREERERRERPVPADKTQRTISIHQLYTSTLYTNSIHQPLYTLRLLVA
jgi:hypothetical protein